MPVGHRHVVPGSRGLAPRSDRSHPRRGLIGAIVCSVVLLAASCGKGVEKVVTLTFSNDRPDAVTISTSTELGTAEKGSAEAAAIEREREALLSGSDDWSLRFVNAEPEFERVTVQRRKKNLERVEHTGLIPVANLQRFFFDTPITVNVLRGEGWNELTIHAGTSTRATRQQKDRVEHLLTNFSDQAVVYFAATRALYDYLDSNDGRSEAIFDAIAASLMSGEKKSDAPPAPELSDTEGKLVSAVSESIGALLDDQKGGAGNVDREFDAAFNPFPAELRVVIPGEPVEVEGFSRTKEGGLFVKTANVLEAVAALEGKWVSPDPLAGLLRTSGSDERRQFVKQMSHQPRHAVDVVRPDELRQALVTAMKPAERYRVRWIAVAPTPRAPPADHPGDGSGEPIAMNDRVRL